MAESLARKTKWDEYANAVDTTTSSKRATFELTVQNVLRMIGDKRDGLLLDIGCGFGEIDILLAENTNFKIIGCDISDKCVERGKSHTRKTGLHQRVYFERGDVRDLQYPDNYFDVITSFGYTSAATYKGVQSEVARVLKPNGLFVCDFINFLCIYKFLSLLKVWGKMKKEEGKYYNLATMKGIDNYFSRYGLYVTYDTVFNTYPPLNFMPKEALLLFEKSFGRIFKRILGRVRLVCFQKK